MNRRLRKKIWICSDVLMDIFPFFERVELGLTLAMLSDRFDVLVDKHFDGKTTELTLWREITIRKDKGPEPKVSVRLDGKFVDFPLPERPLPNKIRFMNLNIRYIDHSVIAFLRSNKHIWDRMGTKLNLDVSAYKCVDVKPIWDVLAREIWPIFATSIHHLSLHLCFPNSAYLDNLRRRISPTILTDSTQLNSIESYYLLPDVIADDGPNATASQALSKWLYTPSKNGQPKRLFCWSRNESRIKEWVNNYKEAFLRATTSPNLNIQIIFYMTKKLTEPFEVVNEGANEKLIMWEETGCIWLLKRCPIIVGETATVQRKKDENWDDNLNNVKFNLWGGSTNCIGAIVAISG